MTRMTDSELLSQINMAETDAISHSHSYMPINRKSLEYYLSCPNGYEVEGQSQVTSNEVSDVVGSDMPSLVRMFLSGREIMEFKPNTQDPRDVQEAEEKTKYVHHIIRNQPSSFKLFHDFLKNVEIQTVGAIHYPWKEVKSTQERSYCGLDEDELTKIMVDLEAESEKQGFEYEITKTTVKQDGKSVDFSLGDNEVSEDAEYDIKFRITRTKKGVVLANIPIEQLLVSKNATTRGDADLIGHRYMERRGDLEAQGFSKKMLDKVPRSSNLTDARMRALRFKDQGRNTGTSPITDRANDLLPVSNLHVRIDYDGDGISERRHIVKIGDIVFTNESFDHVPYAISSAILMPNNLMGRSRAEITLQPQLLGTEILRSTMDNIYDVGSGRIAVNEDTVDMDSLLTDRNQGVVTFSGKGLDVRANVAQLETPFVGDKTLLVMQYLDSKRSASTGELLANQGLEADKIYNETATRFDGIRDAGTAKVELVARVIAETGMRDLFEGIAWTVSHFQSTKDEIDVLGKQLTINPMRWWNDHALEAKVGQGADGGAQAISNLSGIYQIQTQLKAEQSPLVDDADRFNTLSELLQEMGHNQVNDFFNDPQRPEQSAQFLLEQNQQLIQAIQQMQAQQANPLAEAERVEREGDIAIAQGKLALEVQKENESARQFDAELASKERIEILKLEQGYVKIEEENNTDIPGKGTGV